VPAGVAESGAVSGPVGAPEPGGVPQPAGASRAIYLAPWRIDLTVRPGVGRLLGQVGLSQAALARAIRDALEAAGAPRPASLGLILGDDAELAALNVAHLGKSGPTDVLSFPLLPPEAYPPHEGAPGRGRRGRTGAAARAGAAAPAAPAFTLPPGVRPHLGDVVVSVERAIEQAVTGRGGQTGDVGWAPADELRLLVTHGTLHLCGWDHAVPAEEAAMRALERRLLGR